MRFYIPPHLPIDDIKQCALMDFGKKIEKLQTCGEEISSNQRGQYKGKHSTVDAALWRSQPNGIGKCH
jgi:hypothetical protein